MNETRDGVVTWKIMHPGEDSNFDFAIRHFFH